LWEVYEEVGFVRGFVYGNVIRRGNFKSDVGVVLLGRGMCL
jgi:hypothetical protein